MELSVLLFEKFALEFGNSIKIWELEKDLVNELDNSF